MAVLLEAANPDGNLQAVVEDDGRVAYLYLVGGEGSDVGMHAVWVRNHVPAPVAPDQAAMERGEAPLMPAAHCAHPRGAPPLDAHRLRLTWLPEGDGVALWEGDALLAVVPPWSLTVDFPGYAAAAVGEGPFAWSLDGADAIRQRFVDADAYWEGWAKEPGPWPAVQDAQLAAYGSVFGAHRRYFAIDGGRWPPKALALFEDGRGPVLATIGMALRAMPRVEQAHEDPRPHRRIELGMRLPPRTDEATVRSVAGWLSGQSGLPWAALTWFGHGHSLPCEPLGRFGLAAVLLRNADASDAPVALPPCMGDPVRLLWAIPVTASEWTVARERGSAGVLEGLATVRSWPVRGR